MSHRLPLFHHSHDQVIAWYRGRAVTADRFLTDVMHTAEQLPNATHVINLCDDRYHFMVGFAACLINESVTLLPPNDTPGVVNELSREYANCLCLADRPKDGLDIPQHLLQPRPEAPSRTHSTPQVTQERRVAILFTSGSTGKPTANPKYWGDLQKGAQLAAQRFGLQAGRINSLVATVPPQHMYGLETSILIPWFGGVGVHGGRPLFPVDVRDALAALDAPRVLITTPLHLRACVGAELDWPAIEFLISATAPLAKPLAEAAERIMGTRVLEIYGSTETGSIASRRTVESEQWNLYSEMSLEQTPDRFLARGPQLPQPVPLGDQLEIFPDASFKLLGRHSDMIKIAGKRASLGDLNHKLNQIEGVLDGTFVTPDDTDSGMQRLSALVVAPSLNKELLLAALAQSLDAAFLPRPLYLVDELPRSSTGKLPRQALMHLLNRLHKAASN
ncbi:MAG: AMP-binding protein [Gammaproteobacteria bacterium]|nr:AMP-binding protein [Gammaproteobacteria bacterium]